ncbi:Protein YOP1 [Seminavis robusta]|uniref:Protein YOP1 n=1 Tax=Seminavis robusta TaxID=568900 RepID=A0A9N8DX80_9STRA|nr:Protein YOP1 [Seminavis robusta]|eukprot:Sro361_g126650.1 Protein YOP1 (430) ;mRNA; f:62519-63808
MLGLMKPPTILSLLLLLLLSSSLTAALPSPKPFLASTFANRRSHETPNLLLLRGGSLADTNKKSGITRGGADVDKSETWNMSDIQSQDLVYLGIYGIAMAAVFLYCRNFTRSGGLAAKWITDYLPDPYATIIMHGAFFVLGLVVPSVILPPGLRRLLFSPQSVALVGTVFPAYESVRAAVTDGGADDRTWLMYWVIHGIFQYSTDFMDQLALKSQVVFKYWHTFEVLATLWLLLPITDGSTLVYKTVAKPYLVPVVEPIKKYCEGWIATLAITTINASYIWWFSFIFMSLPAMVKRVACLSVGTIFPVAATIMALTTTKDVGKETMKWLTYWPCFGLLNLGMIGVEKFIGSFKGLYVAVLAANLYLMLPMTDGSTLVFREVLVPLFNQRELLLLRDAKSLAADFLKHIPDDRKEEVLAAASEAFAVPKE